MKKFIRIFLISFVAYAALLCTANGQTPEETGEEASLDLKKEIAAGKRLYNRKCAMCHGTNGKGDGMVSRYVFPKPRDFSDGVFKIRSTPSGSLPTDQDIFDTITRGMPGTVMPSWANLTESQRWQLVRYIKTFSEHFEEEEAPEPIVIGAPKPAYAESINRGRRLFIDSGCAACHGVEGKGDGPAAFSLQDRWGYPVVPANLNISRNWRGGSRPRDIFRSIKTGIGGTPMPSWEMLTDDEIWDITNYLLSNIKE
jgi:mono/diheme cytochrome c family protein